MKIKGQCLTAKGKTKENQRLNRISKENLEKTLQKTKKDKINSNHNQCCSSSYITNIMVVFLYT